MVKIRMRRVGRKNLPAFQIVVIDSRKKRDGRYLEKLGFYNPHEKDDKIFDINKDRYSYWVSVGAKPTLSVSKLVNGKYNYVDYTEYKKQQEESQ